ncbi:glycosyltransferase [Erythrobacter arachoides]|uniref:Glycosyltransferase n=1 Tax=Aurantiacibacter arachoides TaxID=1850444 RepID=A0A844ZX60_9SPHN|nr:glycosyltransferase [Aurantiacibacter arachoides]MXO92881.1 glycosyltransferase [Aurantiacibacter arachoides]GGD53739.1 glycosyl transferase family 1 [Aurantiacibacter arachoides]
MPRVLSLATLYPNAHLPRFGTFVARQMEALAARGDWEVTVINPIGVPPFATGRYRALAASAVDGVEGGVTVLRPRFTLIPRLGGPLNPWLIARKVLPLARGLHAERSFDLVDAQFFYPDGPAAARIATALGLPLSIKARGADISHWGQRVSSRRQMVAAGQRATGLLAVSEALTRDMTAIGLPGDKITVHYTGLDRTQFHPRDRDVMRAELAQRFGIRLAQGESLIASVGALIPRKGQALLIRLVAGLPGSHLVLVGEGPDRAMLEGEVMRLGLAARVHFLGNIDHAALPVVLAASDVMALNSASEGLANAWVESLACGTPVVISDVGGARELLRSEMAGRVVPYDPGHDPAAFYKAIRDVLAARYAPEQVAANVAQFSWEANAAALASYYQHLIA